VTDPRAAGRIYNVGEAQAVPEAAWVQDVARAAGWGGEVQVLPGQALPSFLRADMDTRQDLAVDTSRIRRELGYRETVEPQEALSRTVTWERVNPPAQVDPAQFDYSAEDAAWQAWRK
jgi:nucleoside-diphosphate-sugar epimerase